MGAEEIEGKAGKIQEILRGQEVRKEKETRKIDAKSRVAPTGLAAAASVPDGQAARRLGGCGTPVRHHGSA